MTSTSGTVTMLDSRTKIDICIDKICHELRIASKLTALIAEEMSVEDDIELLSQPSSLSPPIPSSIPVDLYHGDFHIDLSLKTVRDVWNEYCVGTENKPPVLEIIGSQGLYTFATTDEELNVAKLRGKLVAALKSEMLDSNDEERVLNKAEKQFRRCKGDFKKLLGLYVNKK